MDFGNSKDYDKNICSTSLTPPKSVSPSIQILWARASILYYRRNRSSSSLKTSRAVLYFFEMSGHAVLTSYVDYYVVGHILIVSYVLFLVCSLARYFSCLFYLGNYWWSKSKSSTSQNARGYFQVPDTRTYNLFLLLLTISSLWRFFPGIEKYALCAELLVFSAREDESSNKNIDIFSIARLLNPTEIQTGFRRLSLILPTDIKRI